jgi:hypothetical protein
LLFTEQLKAAFLIWIQKNAKMTGKKIKSEEILCFKVLDVLFGGPDASSVARQVLHGGLIINIIKLL